MNGPAPLRSFALPFHVAPLLLVATFSLLLLLALKGGLLAIPLLAILASWFFKYCFMLLDHAAHGRPDAPVLTPEAANPVGEMRPLAYATLIAAFYVATRALGEFTYPGIASALRLIALAALPAIIATHTITGSWSDALNLRTIAITIHRLGSGYLVILIVAIACWWLGRAILLDAGRLSFLLRTALLMLVWMMLFSLLGGVLYSRRLELDFEPEHSPERSQRRDDRERNVDRNTFIDQVFGEFRSGNSRNAWETIQKRATQSADAIAEYAWIYERVATWPNPRLANRLAQELLPLLLAAKRNDEAFRIVRGRVQADAEFRPRDSGDVIKLAELARDAGDRRLARTLLQDFDRRFPEDAARNSAQRLLDQLTR